MRLSIVLLATCSLVLGLLGPWRAPSAHAEDGAPAPGGVWVFDVRVVRVDSPHAEVAEQEPPFPELQGTTLRLPWPDCLARLKKRGRTTLLLDQRLTALPGMKATLSTERMTPVLAIATQSDATEQRRAQIVKTGVRFSALPSATQLAYDLEIHGVSRPPGPLDAPAQTAVAWNGTLPGLDGETLVLVHREQVLEAGVENARSVEHYAFVTGRFVPSK